MTTSPARRRVALVVPAVLLVAAALAGCTADETYGDTAVLTYNESRTRYLDAMCPLRAEPAFWRRIDTADDAPAVAERLLPIADAAIEDLAGGGLPYPRRIRTPVGRLLAEVRANRAYFAAAAEAGDAAALAALPAPDPVPDALLQPIEETVLVSAAAGSPSCTAHGVTPSPTASPSAG